MKPLAFSPDQRPGAENDGESILNKSYTLKEKIENSHGWKVNNLEYDLRTTGWILDKVRGDRVYAQHLYAALCNNIWQKLETWCILSNKTWDCSWRHAGGIVADMRGEGTYTDWYCSGRKQFDWSHLLDNNEFDFATATDTDIERIQYSNACVSEQVVTAEISADLKRLGWQLSAAQDDFV